MSLTLIVTGMHRSGTSLTASFIQAIGINLGENLFKADTFNAKGYFEDVDFLEFQRSVLQNCCPPGEPGWHDWGWTESEWLDRSQFQNYIESAQNLIALRRQQLELWGWKDPRTTLMLDFWKSLLPEARYLLVYRFPWDVADSIARLNAPIFSEHPDYALKIWAFYNRHLLEFYHQNAERCILLNVNAWLQQPERLIELLENKLVLTVGDAGDKTEFKEIYDSQIFKNLDWNDPIVRDLYQTDPQYFSLLDELDRAADLPSNFTLSSVIGDLSPSQAVASENCELSVTEDSEKTTPVKKISTSKGRQWSDRDEAEEIIVSVVIPCFNQGEFILEAISSVESCQEQVYEILIVNDASTEPLTQRILNYLKEKGYSVIDHSNNQGLAEARNTGIKKAKGRYVLPLDSDNKIKPEYLTKAIEILENEPKVGVVYGNAEFFGERIGLWKIPDFDINKIVMRNYIDACAVFRKKVWEDCGGYDSKIPEKLGYEDWDFWLGAAEHGWKFYHFDEVLFYYRVRDDSMVSQCRIPENHEKLVRYICTKHLDLYTTNFAIILAEKDSALLREQLRSDDLKMQLAQAQEQLHVTHTAWEQAYEQMQLVQTAWEQAQADVKSTHSGWEQANNQMQRIQTAWDQTQEEARRIYAAWQTSQEQLQRIEVAWEQTQEEARRIYAAWQTSQEQLQRIQAAWEQTQEEMRSIYAAWQTSQEQLQRIQAAWEQAQAQLRQTQAEWERSQVQLNSTQAQLDSTQIQLDSTQAQLDSTQAQLEQAQAKIRAMESSKFWQLRNSWVRLKQAIGLNKND